MAYVSEVGDHPTAGVISEINNSIKRGNSRGIVTPAHRHAHGGSVSRIAVTQPT